MKNAILYAVKNDDPFNFAKGLLWFHVLTAEAKTANFWFSNQLRKSIGKQELTSQNRGCNFPCCCKEWWSLQFFEGIAVVFVHLPQRWKLQLFGFLINCANLLASRNLPLKIEDAILHVAKNDYPFNFSKGSSWFSCAHHRDENYDFLVFQLILQIYWQPGIYLSTSRILNFER